MTHTILKSAIDAIPDFPVRAAAHAKEMRDWRAQMKLAAEHKDNDKIPEIERYVERPMPRETPLIEAAVNHDDLVDFEIVDDGPTPDQVLAMKKVSLSRMIERTEFAAIDEVTPSGKIQLMNLRRSDISKSDAVIISNAQNNIDSEHQKFLDLSAKQAALASSPKPGVIISVVKAMTGPSAADLAAAAELKVAQQQAADQGQKVDQLRAEWLDRESILAKGRDPANHAFMIDYDARIAKVDAIRRQAAQMLADVSDLTVETIDAWKMTQFDK